MGAGLVKKEKFSPVFFFFLVRAFSIPRARLSRSMEQAIFSSVLFLKIIVTNVLYCCTVNVSRHNYFLANKNLLFYRYLFVYIIKRTLITRRLEDMNFILSMQKQYFTHSLRSFVTSALLCHSKI